MAHPPCYGPRSMHFNIAGLLPLFYEWGNDT